MFYKKIYIIMAIILTISGGLLTLTILYGNFTHNAPVRAKQVFSTTQQSPCESLRKNNKYNTANNVQAIKEVEAIVVN